jgi:hypothetical protein
MQIPPRFSMEEAIAQGTLFVGNPDTVCRQILDFHNKVGGFEHLILMGRSGFMTHEQTETSIRLFAREVLPRLGEATRERAVQGVSAQAILMGAAGRRGER